MRRGGREETRENKHQWNELSHQRLRFSSAAVMGLTSRPAAEALQEPFRTQPSSLRKRAIPYSRAVLTNREAAGYPAGANSDLILRSLRSKRLEGWTRAWIRGRPSRRARTAQVRCRRARSSR